MLFQSSFCGSGNRCCVCIFMRKPLKWHRLLEVIDCLSYHSERLVHPQSNIAKDVNLMAKHIHSILALSKHISQYPAALQMTSILPCGKKCRGHMQLQYQGFQSLLDTNGVNSTSWKIKALWRHFRHLLYFTYTSGSAPPRRYKTASKSS